MDKPFCSGFVVLELSKLLKYETYYDKLQPSFGQENLQKQKMDTDSIVLSMNTRDIIKELENLEVITDLCNLDENHIFLGIKTQK